jgi:predicted nucleic acid-binding protein
VILVDTSVWVDHLRRTEPLLVERLRNDEVSCHPFVIGELACGRLRRRDEVLRLLGTLPVAPAVAHDEVLGFVERHRLAGSGIGWIDAHLLASAALGRLRVWTQDRRLRIAARRLGLADGDA